MIELVELQRIDSAERELIVRPLAEASTWRGFAFAPSPIVVAIQVDGEIEGGLIAATYWDWMYVEIVAVPERLRRCGIGRRLLERAEAIAAGRGCRGAWVDTYSFQSPGFYEALGYRPFGMLPDYPKGESRIFYAKSLNGDPLSPEIHEGEARNG